jgi:hypothetical protein
MRKHVITINTNSFDTSSFIALKVTDLLKLVIMHNFFLILHNNILSPRFLDVVFEIIDLVVLKRSTVQLVVSLLSYIYL